MPSDFSPRIAKNTIAWLNAANRRLEDDWNRERDGRLKAEAAIARVREAMASVAHISVYAPLLTKLDAALDRTDQEATDG